MPSRFVANAILVPSGDQVGWASDREPDVSCVTPVPFAFITKMWLIPASRLETNTILLPSGDHAGSPSRVVSLVSCTTFAPSASMTKMSNGTVAFTERSD